MSCPQSAWLLLALVSSTALMQSQERTVVNQPLLPANAHPVALAPDTQFAKPGLGYVAADFNGDGKMDIALTSSQNLDLEIYLGHGDGSFQPAISYKHGYYFSSLLVGDFNGDGKLDLIAGQPYLCGGCGGYPSYFRHIFLGTGDGHFVEQPVAHQQGGLPIAVGDFNGDGKLDVVTTTPDYYGDDWFVMVSLGRGDGTFNKAVGVMDALQFSTPAVGDFDGDGKLDLAIPSGGKQYDPAVTVMLGNGDGTFVVSQTAPLQCCSGASIAAAADLNGDGKVDLVTDTVDVLMGNGDGTFTPDGSVSVRGLSQGLALGDFNGDGHLDIVSYSFDDPGETVLLLGNGDAKFESTSAFSNGALIDGAADFNGDGRLDLITSKGLLLQVSARLSPAVLNFAEQPVGTQSHPQIVTLTNLAPGAIQISSIGIGGGTGGDFLIVSNTCHSGLAAGASCKIGISFTPQAAGVIPGALTVVAQGQKVSPSVAVLNGVGVTP